MGAGVLPEMLVVPRCPSFVEVEVDVDVAAYLVVPFILRHAPAKTF